MDMNTEWPIRNTKDQFIEFCQRMDIGESTGELEAEWMAYCQELDTLIEKELPDNDKG